MLSSSKFQSSLTELEKQTKPKTNCKIQMKLQMIPASQSNPKQKTDAGNITVLTSNCQSHCNKNSRYCTETNKPGKQNKAPRKETTKVSKCILKNTASSALE